MKRETRASVQSPCVGHSGPRRGTPCTGCGTERQAFAPALGVSVLEMQAPAPLGLKRTPSPRSSSSQATMSFFAAAVRVRLAVPGLKRLVEVGVEVVHVLDPGRQAEQVGGAGRAGALDRGAVLDQAFDAAQ